MAFDYTRLTGLRLRNFKCFEDTGIIPLAPLTLIFGQNNSGKSSLLQSLLLLRQSIDAPQYGPRLNLAGPIYPAGTYSDIVCGHESRRRISIELHCAGSESGNVPDEVPGPLSLTFAADEPGQPKLHELVVRREKRQALQIRRGPRGSAYHLNFGSTHWYPEGRAFSFPVNGFFPLIGSEGRSKARASAQDFARNVLGGLEALLKALRVIGAFRAYPERRYEYRGLQRGLDPTGKEAASALISNALGERHVERDLGVAVDYWLAEMAGVRLEPIRPTDQAGRLFELRLRDQASATSANLTDMGFGIAQALPVFVEGLRTEHGGLFVVQEPEIHLHPDAQLAMADFLIRMAGAGKHVIVETHSENILLRVRREVASGQGLEPEDVSVLHVSRDQRGRGVVLPLNLDELGQIGNWPTGFMEDATEERMALLEAIAKKAEG